MTGLGAVSRTAPRCVRPGPAQSAQRRAHVALELLNRVGPLGSLTTAASRKVAVSLVALAKKGPLPSAVRTRPGVASVRRPRLDARAL